MKRIIRNDIMLPILAVLGGIAGYKLRAIQWEEAYLEKSEFFLVEHPSIALLLGLLAVLAVLFLTQVLRIKKDPEEDFLPAFRAPSPVYMGLMVASAILFLVAGLLGLQEGADQHLLYMAYFGTYPATLFISIYLCAALSFLAAPATLLVGREAYRGRPMKWASLLVVFPAACGLVWMFSIHLANGTNPILLDYGFRLAASICLMLTQYYMAAYFHDRPHPRRALFFALMGIPLSITTLADELTRFDMVLMAALCLSALATALTLMRNHGLAPAWVEFPSFRIVVKTSRDDSNNLSE